MIKKNNYAKVEAASSLNRNLALAHKYLGKCQSDLLDVIDVTVKEGEINWSRELIHKLAELGIQIGNLQKEAMSQYNLYMNQAMEELH